MIKNNFKKQIYILVSFRKLYMKCSKIVLTVLENILNNKFKWNQIVWGLSPIVIGT